MESSHDAGMLFLEKEMRMKTQRQYGQLAALGQVSKSSTRLALCPD